MAVRMEERFDGDRLDTSVWFPFYLSHWSSRAESAATYAVSGGELRLWIPPTQALWSADRHEEPLRVSALQTGAFSGPVGSTVGQQPLAPGMTVREEQPPFWGYTPTYGRFEVRMRGVVTERSMVAFWMSGIEDRPERSGEILVAEVFGSAPHNVGMGIREIRDPLLRDDVETPWLDLELSEFHLYGVDWRPGRVTFSVDGRVVRVVHQAPDYPLQLMLGVFDFPARGGSDDDVPELFVTHVTGEPLHSV
ncbi:glycoside hydrolase family 16 protein [Jiangella alkaliphila]|uniref:Glycosyl hydrolases family 16 n=1 Tax=Jiangella alkaliphila TaxID=419479 RepID=A0A1H2I3J9_9ACTN|nr:glycoside hydrolase family 16 protein [Jiangella alkaliphila]SDU38535.1 Glycosyl hydrolases family 16 [Jiangella alkaliphila]